MEIHADLSRELGSVLEKDLRPLFELAGRLHLIRRGRVVLTVEWK